MNTTPRRGTTIGLVIGQEAIYAVQARMQEGRLEVLARAAVETPKGAVEGALVRQEQRVGKAIAALWRRAGFRETSVSVVVPAGGCQVRALRLPNVGERERRTIVRSELQQIGALPGGDGGYDFLWMSEPNAGGFNMADAYVFYTEAAVVNGIREALHHAHLQLSGLEPASLAAMRAYVASTNERQPVAILCPFAEHTDLSIYDGSQIRHLRRIPSGREDLLRPGAPAPTQVYSLTPLGAEEYSEGGVERAGPGPAVSTEARSRMPPLPEDGGSARHDGPPWNEPSGPFLAAEVARSLRFYAREHEDRAQPALLVVVAPQRQAAELGRQLAATAELSTITPDVLGAFDPPRPVVTSPTSEPDLEYVEALGAAAAALGEEFGVRRLSLSQGVAAGHSALAAYSRYAFTGALGCLVLTVGLNLGLSQLFDDSARQSRALAKQITELSALWGPARDAAALEGVAGRQRLTQVPAASVLGRVAAASGPGIHLTALRITPDGRLSLEGSAADTPTLQRFMLALARGKSIRQPALESFSEETPGGTLTFRITGIAGRLKRPAASTAP